MLVSNKNNCTSTFENFYYIFTVLCLKKMPYSVPTVDSILFKKKLNTLIKSKLNENSFNFLHFFQSLLKRPRNFL